MIDEIHKHKRLHKRLHKRMHKRMHKRKHKSFVDRSEYEHITSPRLHRWCYSSVLRKMRGERKSVMKKHTTTSINNDNDKRWQSALPRSRSRGSTTHNHPFPHHLSPKHSPLNLHPNSHPTTTQHKDAHAHTNRHINNPA